MGEYDVKGRAKGVGGLFVLGSALAIVGSLFFSLKLTGIIMLALAGACFLWAAAMAIALLRDTKKKEKEREKPPVPTPVPPTPGPFLKEDQPGSKRD